MLQDRQGFIWVGTANGLNRYDGYKFLKLYNEKSNNNSLSDNRILAINQDSVADLWILSADAVINRLNTSTFSVERFPLFAAKNISVHYMVMDENKRLWIGTSDGVFIFDTVNNQIHKFKHKGLAGFERIDIKSIMIDSSGRLWFGTAGYGVFSYDANSNDLFFINSNQNRFTKADTFYTIFEDTQNRIWFGTNKGLLKYDPYNYLLKRYQGNKYNDQSLSSDIIYAICEDFNKNNQFLWLGTKGGGVNLFDIKNEHFQTHKCESNTLCCLGSNTINTILKDQSGTVWLGTDCCGLNKFLNSEIELTSIESMISIPGGWGHYPVWSFYEDKSGDIWLATSNGLKKLDQTNKKLIHFDHDKDDPESLSNNVVTALVKDKKGSLWIGTEYGLNRFDDKKKSFKKFLKTNGSKNSLSDNGVVSLMCDSRGNLWIGTRIGGLNMYNPVTKEFYQYSGHPGKSDRMINSAVMEILESIYSNVIWVATYSNGLFALDTETKKLKKYENNPADINSISHNNITSLVEDTSGNLWIGTHGGGLNKYDYSTKSFERFTEIDGLPDVNIFSLVKDDDNNIWLSTAGGLARFNPESKIFRNYSLGGASLMDKLNYGTLYRCSDGTFYYSTFGGIQIFEADHIHNEPIIPSVVITDFRLSTTNDIKINYKTTAGRIYLDYDQNFFTIEFSVLDFVDPPKNKFQYKLDGIDIVWNYAGTNNFAAYTDIRPGSYNFTVKGANSDGIWSNKNASLQVIINPPLWATWWAYTIYVLVIIAFVFTANRTLIKRERLKNYARLKEFEAQKLEEINHIKSRFFTNISHEIRTPLTLILGPLEKVLNKTRNEQSRMYLNMMQRNASTLHNLINQLLDHEKIETGLMRLKVSEQDAVALVKKYIMSFIPLAESQEKSIKFITKIPALDVYIDNEKLYKILSNLISNAVKYSVKDVSVELAKCNPQKVRIGSHQYYMSDGDYICISVKDDGCGIPESEIDKIFDRYYQVRHPENIINHGSGIGLSLTKDLIQLHHGFIDVESHPGNGSTFFVFLPIGLNHFQINEIEPLKSDPLDQLVPESDKLNDVKRYQNNTQNVTDEMFILVVEDNQEMIWYLRSILETEYHIIEAFNGAEAYRIAVAHIPDLIISDIMMPGTDGFYLVEKLKSDERTSHIPVILLTAKASLQTKLNGLKLGADDYLSKPFVEKELIVRIKNLIEQRRKLRKCFSEQPTIDFYKNVPTKTDEKFLKKIIEFVESHISDPELTVESLAGVLCISRVQLHRKLKAITDKSPSEFIRKIKLYLAAGLLAKRSSNVFEVAYQVGFNNLSYFAKCFKEEYGISPSEYIRGKVNQNI